MPNVQPVGAASMAVDLHASKFTHCLLPHTIKFLLFSLSIQILSVKFIHFVVPSNGHNGMKK